MFADADAQKDGVLSWREAADFLNRLADAEQRSSRLHAAGSEMDARLEAVAGLFREFDKNANNKIELQEVLSAFTNKGSAGHVDHSITAQHVTRMFADADAMKRGFLNWQEAANFLDSLADAEQRSSRLHSMGSEMDARLEVVADMFRELDKNGNNKIELKEVLSAFPETGAARHSQDQPIAARRVAEMFAHADSQRDGVLNWQEAANFLDRLADAEHELQGAAFPDADAHMDAVAEFFREFDKNGNNRVELQEVLSAFPEKGVADENQDSDKLAVTPEHVVELFAGADATGDGFLNWQEASNFVDRLAAHAAEEP